MFSRVVMKACSDCPRTYNCKYSKEHNMAALIMNPKLIEQPCETVAAFLIEYLASQSEEFQHIYALYFEQDNNIKYIRQAVPGTTNESIRKDLFDFAREATSAFQEWKKEYSISERHDIFEEYVPIAEEIEQHENEAIDDIFSVSKFLFSSKV